MTEWRRWAASFVLAGMSLAAAAQEPQTAVPPKLAEHAREVAAAFAGTLGQTLRAQLETSGPVAAISVCRDLAPAIARDLSLQKGWRVTRVSLKQRNPLLGSADAFEQTVLRAFDAAVAGGADPATLDRVEIATEPDGTYFRYLKALPTVPACLTCHGPRDTLPPGVADSLAAQYPHDRATGYAAGTVRGAISIKVRLER